MGSLTVDLGSYRSADGATIRTYNDALSIVAETMRSIELTGRYTLCPKEKVKWKPRHGEKICIRPSQGREIRLRVKPGNNDTGWDYALIAANNIDLEAVRSRLEAVLGQEFIDGSHEQVIAEEAVKTEQPDPLLAIERMRHAIERRNQRSSEMGDIRNRIARIEGDIQKLNEDKESLMLELMELEEQNAKDPDAKAADQFVLLLNSLKA